MQVLTVGLLPSPLKKFYYRLKGYRIARGVRIGFGSVIDARESCTIEEDVRIGLFAIITCEKIAIGKRTNIRSFTIFMVPQITIGKDVIVSESAIVRAQLPYPDSAIEIGDRAHIFPYCILDPTRKLTIGPESAVGFASYIFTHGAYKSKLDGYPVTFGEVKIGRAVWLPCRLFIMPGVTIGDEAVVGTGSVVNRSVEPGAFVLGQPAKQLKSRDEFISHYDTGQRMDMLQDILKEFGEYVAHFGKVQATVTGGRSLVLAKGSARQVVRLVERVDELPLGDSSAGDIVICHDDIDRGSRAALEGRGIRWFSYQGHACCERMDDICEALLEYLNRYGLRFDRP